MSVQKQATTTDDQTPKNSSDPKEQITATVGSKEAPGARLEEEKLLKEVVERSREADLEVAKKFEEALGQEAGLSRPEIKVPEDFAGHGVKSPQVEASVIADKGSDIELPISEQEYKSGEKIAIKGLEDHQSVIGVSSLAAFVMYLGRIIKVAHKHAKKVIFRRPPAEGLWPGWRGIICQ